MQNDYQGIVFVGPSGVGKSTLIKQLMEVYDFFAFSISHTTRPIRHYEENHKDYHFVNMSQFTLLENADSFIETAVVHGNHYGTTFRAVDDVIASGKTIIFDVDVQGVRSLHQTNYKLFYIFVTAPVEILVDRINNRGSETYRTLQNRLNTAKIEFDALENEPGLFDYVFENILPKEEAFDAFISGIPIATTN
ncbi:hypothetical protein PCE1_000860 [Barthelona sp. PCE]